MEYSLNAIFAKTLSFEVKYTDEYFSHHFWQRILAFFSKPGAAQ
jgi:hypothetical protein